MDALVGHTGFVGGNLAAQHDFAAHFNSRSIDAIRGRRFETLVFAGAQGVKWWANANAAADWAGIARAVDCLSEVEARQVILISTVDVLPVVAGIDESFDPSGLPNHAYGANRLRLEAAMAARFADLTVVRLPGLTGPGLRKNIIFDLMHGNMVDRIDPGARFQFYDLNRLWADIAIVRASRMRLVHLVPEPLPTQAIADRLFPSAVLGSSPPGGSVAYDVRTRHAELFGSPDQYLYNASEAMDRIAVHVAGPG